MQMTNDNMQIGLTFALIFLGIGSMLSSLTYGAEPLKACATVPELGSLLREVGGQEIEVTVFAKGTEDPHFVEARPSFVKDLARADLYVQTGLQLEMGWAPLLLRGARNAKVQPGGPGYLDVSTAITPLGVPSGPVDRSQGDVHPLGNPHYLLDPMNGLKVARLMRDQLSRLRPTRKAYFDQRFDDFTKRLAVALIGEKLAETYEYRIEQLMVLHDGGRLDALLDQQGQTDWLGGWLERLRPHRHTMFVADHNMWVYFSHRFGLTEVGYMEPKPGLTPTTKHLSQLVEQMKRQGVKLIITSAYFHPRHAEFLSRNTTAGIARLAHQVEALPEASDYLAMFEHNVSTVIKALEGDRD